MTPFSVISILLLSLLSSSVFGQDAYGAEALNGILSFLESIDASSIGVIAIVAEFVLRLIPSKKPLSIIRTVTGTLSLVGKIFVKTSSLLDKIFLLAEKKPEAKDL